VGRELPLLFVYFQKNYLFFVFFLKIYFVSFSVFIHLFSLLILKFIFIFVFYYRF